MLPPSDDELQSLASSVARRFGDAGQRLVTAESCTGGWIAKVCTDLPGSSRWFLGSVVAYANESKQRLLGVSARLLQEHGAVSEPVVRAMVTGALQQIGGDRGVAVSGVAGPDGGTPEKPVGTVWLAWAWRTARGDTVESSQIQCAGDRDAVRRLTVQRALERLLEP